ncbi:unnamed protein product, partial [Owenia fusiformis]
EYMDYTGYAKLYPRAAAYITRPCNLSLSSRKNNIDGYFPRMQALNQVVTLAHQLNSDVCNLYNHKYVAYQIALLYQSMNALGSSIPSLLEFKSDIERNFKFIKEELNSLIDEDLTPQLSQDRSQWVVILTSGSLSNNCIS